MIFLDTLEQVRMGVGVKFALTDFVNIEIRPKWYKMKHNGGKAFIGQLVRLEIHIITKQAVKLGEGLVDLKHYMDKTFNGLMPRFTVTLITCILNV